MSQSVRIPKWFQEIFLKLIKCPSCLGEGVITNGNPPYELHKKQQDNPTNIPLGCGDCRGLGIASFRTIKKRLKTGKFDVDGWFKLEQEE